MDFWTCWTEVKGNTPFKLLCWEYVTNTIMICVYQQKETGQSRHLLLSAMGTSLVTCSCRFRLWCLFEHYDHEIRFTCTRTRVEKSKMWWWNWIWPVNGLCDLDYSSDLSFKIVSMRVASQMMCSNTTGYLGLNITGYLGPTSMYLQWDANKIRYTTDSSKNRPHPSSKA